MTSPRLNIPGQIVIFNGAPRSGKTSIVLELQGSAAGAWVNLGVDSSMAQLPEALRPGIGLRPGGERPELEELVVALYYGLWDSVAAHARVGVSVVVDVGLHESYSQPRMIRRDAARRLKGLPVLLVGVRCPLGVILERRAESWGLSGAKGRQSNEAVERWQTEVHAGLTYDLEVDTAVLTPAQCAEQVATRIENGPPGEAFARLALER
jgi:chloramphenicol 3-O phosphotransferase